MLKPRTNHTTRKSLRFESLEDRRLLAGLVSWWTGDNTAADAVGTNHGTLINGATYAAGQVGQAFSLDGVNDRIQVADSESLKLTGSLSVEAWVRVNSLPTGPNGIIFWRGDDRGGLDPYKLRAHSDGTISFGVTQTEPGVFISTAVPIGQFFHVAGTLDDATGAMRLYINGVLEAQTVTSVRPFRDLDPASNPSIGIGNHGGWPATPHNIPFHGLIDELKVYDIALTEAEVLANYNATPRTISISDATVNEGDDVARFVDVPISASTSPVDFAKSIVQGPNGDYYVTSANNDSVMRYDGTTFAFKGVFVSSGSGGLNNPIDLVFVNGDLLVSSADTNAVLRYDGDTGAFLGAFVPSRAQGIERPTDLLVHNGALYIGAWSGDVHRYDINTGAFIDKFVQTGSGGLDAPAGLAFGPDGNFYVAEYADGGNNAILRYDGNTGAFLNEFIPDGSGGLTQPGGMKFGPDGNLYVVNSFGHNLFRYAADTGQFLGVFVPAQNSMGFTRFIFDGNQMLVTNDDQILRFEIPSWAVFYVTLDSASNAPVSIDFSVANGTASASDYVSRFGTLTFAPGQTAQMIVVPILDDAVVEGNETYFVNLSNPVGATVADGHGVGTIIDNDDNTKFYVVDDATQNRTYEYGATGGLVESYNMTSGNSAPRGAASNVAGDKVWVVDANRNVYVYNKSGGVIGSWTARTLPNNATVEGIATNGTDVWIVDAKNDRVYRYAGAASRTSDSQFAASSFPLNSGNTSPKDIVTNGQHLWVVNDSSTDRVFKYTIGGQLVGSWTIDSANKSPTGITVDPANAQHIWIVDSGTDQIYQYTGAASLTSGSQSAATSFALATGNTNPQGIADPPLAGDEPASAASAVAVNFPSVSTSMPRRDYTPIRRLLHSAITNAPTSDELNLLARSNLAANRAIVDSDRWRSPVAPAEAAVLDAALEGIEYNTWPELLGEI